jgi:hypothetical protein
MVDLPNKISISLSLDDDLSRDQVLKFLNAQVRETAAVFRVREVEQEVQVHGG